VRKGGVSMNYAMRVWVMTNHLVFLCFLRHAVRSGGWQSLSHPFYIYQDRYESDDWEWATRASMGQAEDYMTNGRLERSI
jgi:hypothetical protein